MAAKTMTARESIEDAFAVGSERKLKTAEIVERVKENPRSKIVEGTIRTQLSLHSKKGDWIKRVERSCCAESSRSSLRPQAARPSRRFRSRVS